MNSYSIVPKIGVLKKMKQSFGLRRETGSGPRVLFLDRDGVINEKAAPGDYVTSWEEFRFCEGIARLLISARERGLRSVVITNQQCVGKGLLNRDALDVLHQRMVEALERAGAGIDRVYYCPHLESEGCECRKPRPGLLNRAIRDLGGTIDVANSFFLGDTATDMIAGKAVGLQTILIGASRGLRDASLADHVVGSLRDVEALL